MGFFAWTSVFGEPFVPTDVADLELQLHRDDLSVDGTSWPDRSGNGRNASQATNGPTKVGGRAVFDGTQYMDLVGLPTLNTMAVYMAGDFGGGSTSCLLGWTGSTGILTDRSGSVAIADPSFRLSGASVTGQQVLSWQVDATGPGFEAFRDGVSIGAAAYDGTWGGVSSPRLCAIGGTSATWHPIITLDEVLLYSRIPTAEEDAAITNYLLAYP